MKTFNISHVDGDYICKVEAASEENAFYAMFDRVSGGYPNMGTVLGLNQASFDRYVLIGTSEGSNPFESYVVTEIK